MKTFYLLLLKSTPLKVHHHMFFHFKAYRGGFDTEGRVKSASRQVIQTNTAYPELFCIKW